MERVMQHCFGSLGTGGPIAALERLQVASGRRYPMLLQESAANGLDVGLVRRFVHEIKEAKPRLIHVRGLGNEGFHGVLAARVANVPNILVSIHGSQRDLRAPTHALRRWLVVHALERLTLSLATHVATVYGAALERDFLQPYKDKLVGAVPNGVSAPPVLAQEQRVALRDKLGLGRDSVVGVCVSRLVPDKGYQVLANALHGLRADLAGFELVVVGGGDASGAIRRSFEGLGEAKVRFVGQQADVLPYLQASDFYVQASLHENLSNALLEAMACGLPAIATSVGGTPEVLAKGGGILIPAGEPGPLADALVKLLGSAELRSILGEEARRNVGKNYSVQRMVDGWNAVYDRILDA